LGQTFIVPADTKTGSGSLGKILPAPIELGSASKKVFSAGLFALNVNYSVLIDGLNYGSAVVHCRLVDYGFVDYRFVDYRAFDFRAAHCRVVNCR